jgi:hypothetical protein
MISKISLYPDAKSAIKKEKPRERNEYPVSIFLIKRNRSSSKIIHNWSCYNE